MRRWKSRKLWFPGLGTRKEQENRSKDNNIAPTASLGCAANTFAIDISDQTLSCN
jgi:hypothetical protein